MDTFTIRDLSFAYPNQTAPTIDGLTLRIKQGDFLVLCGPSGCGKSTLLRQLKPTLAPHGTQTGFIFFEGQPLGSLDLRRQSQRIGFVQQSPDNQLVTDKVWHELAFGLESLGYDTPTIRRRVAETASFFGIQTWFHKEVAQLSGGQKQLLNLAAVMVMQPSILILDEPTAQLDPIAGANFLSVLGKINRELGTTVLLTEHRLDEVFPLATAVAAMDHGRLLCVGTPTQVGEALRALNHPLFLAMPTPMRVWAAVKTDAPCPISVREGRDWLETRSRSLPLNPLPDKPTSRCSGRPVLSAQELWFKYEKDGPDVVKGLSLHLQKGELLALLGGNGTGKSTSLKLLAGLQTPYRGQVQISGSVGMLPQDPQTLFLKKTVEEDLLELAPSPSAAARTARLCRLEGLLDRHPYDLSGGEQQRAALAKVLLLDPDILLLDEPTKGLDGEFKQIFAGILQSLLDRGVSILMVSHDVEFCAQCAHRCVLFFDGSIVTEGTPRSFFSGNRFYTTAANRMARTVLPQAVTPEDLIAACGGVLPSPPTLPEPESRPPEPRQAPWEPPVQKRDLPKRTLAASLLLLLLVPLTLLVGEVWLEGRHYQAISLAILFETILPFFLAFEGRRPQARELVVVAVLCAIGVAGRAFFFMLPQFKPVLALTTLAGVALGGETGFLVGAMTMLASNMLFSQGPWTPWQMFAMGIIGFLAGILFRRGLLPRSKKALSLFGALAALVVYGGIMNVSSAILWTGSLTPAILLSYFITGFPMDCVHACATWLFLWLCAEPMLEKLDRIKEKYGLMG